MLNCCSFYPSNSRLSHSDLEHFNEESRDYLPSNSRENQSEDDSESTADGFDRFTDHQVHLSTSRQWLCSVFYDIWIFVLSITIAKL